MNVLETFWTEFHNTTESDKRILILKKFADIKIKKISRQKLSSKRMRFNVKQICRDLVKNRCFVCYAIPTIRHHIVQLQNGGKNCAQNLIALCKSCHANIHPWLTHD